MHRTNKQVAAHVARLTPVILALLLLAAPARAERDGYRLASTDDSTRRVETLSLENWNAPAKAATAKPQPAPALPSEDRLVETLVHWIHLQDETEKQPFEELTGFLAANPAWPGQGAMIRKAEQAIDASTPDQAILAWFARHRARTAEGAIAWTRALSRNGQESKAVAQARLTWVHYDLDEAQEKDFLAEFGKDLEQDHHLARLDRLLWDGKRSAAQRQAQRLGEGRRLLADARLRLMGQNRGVDRAVQNVPTWLQSDTGLLYERIRWRRRKDMDKDAAELILGFAGDMQYPDRWWLEREILARRFLVKEDYKTAYRLVAGHGLETGVERADAEFMAGWISLRFLRDPHAAFKHFAGLYESVSYPISRARGAYWAGRAAEAAGEKSVADQWYAVAANYGTTFYGQLGADRLGRQSPPPNGYESHVDPDEAAAFERDDLVRLARLMIALRKDRKPVQMAGMAGATPPAPRDFVAAQDPDTALIPFLRHIAWRGKTATHWVKSAQLARDAGRTEIAVYIAKRAATDGILLRDLGYPTMVVEGELPLNTALLHALVRQESAFDVGAHSRAGARGLMQLMPATARKIAKDLRIKDHSTDRLTEDPFHNLTLGSAYLGEMLTRYDGSMVMALAAYNAGPHRVDRWLKDNGDPRESLDDAIDWIESIPFSETRNYVQRILETLPIYRWKLEDRRVVLLSPEDLTRGLPGYDGTGNAR